MIDVPVYIISLRESIERRERVVANCLAFGINPVVIDAVNGKLLKEDEIKRFYNDKGAMDYLGRSLLAGEIGCTLSHIKIYSEMVNNDVPTALILEDDAVLCKDFLIALSLCLEFSKSWDLILMGHYYRFEGNKEIESITSFWQQQKLSEKFKLKRLAGPGLGTHGYLITNQGARKLLKELNPFYRPIDRYTTDNKILNIYALLPTVIKPDLSFNSLIDFDDVRQADKRSRIADLLRGGYFYKFARFIYRSYLKFKPFSNKWR